MDALESAAGSEVRLRYLRPEDHARFVEWLRDPEVRRHFLGGDGASCPADPDWVPGRGPAEDRRRWRQPGTDRPAGHMVRAIETTAGTLLGWIELRDVNWRRRTGELRICLGDPATWGRGYGSAAIRLFLDNAFTIWGLRGIHLRVATWNERAVRAYRRCGFRREGRLCAGTRGGEDLWLMSVRAPALPSDAAAGGS